MATAESPTDDPVTPGPAWLVVPVRVLALAVVLPLRLGHDLLRLTLGAAGRLVSAVLRALRPIPLGIGWCLNRLWNAFQRAVLAPSGRPARWCHRVLLVPAGRFLALVVLRPLRVLGRGLAWAGKALLRGLGWALAIVVLLPAALVWRLLLRPALVVLTWPALVIGRGVAHGWNVFRSATAWSWRLAARLLRRLWHILAAVPARWVRRVLGVPARALLRTVRLTVRDVRLTLRRTFLGR